jgi:hypothetical protein
MLAFPMIHCVFEPRLYSAEPQMKIAQPASTQP